MTSRYINKFAALNGLDKYRHLFRERGVKYINQFRTSEMTFPTSEQMASLREVDYTWGTGDRYFKLAHKFYGDVSLWWVIAWYNQAPTESHLSTGEVIQIPLPLDSIMAIYMEGS